MTSKAMLDEILPKLNSHRGPFLQTDSHKIIFNKDELRILYKQSTWYYNECKNMIIILANIYWANHFTCIFSTD